MKAMAFVVVLSMVLLSTAALAGEPATQGGRTDVSRSAQAGQPSSRTVSPEASGLSFVTGPASHGAKADVPGLMSYQGTLTRSSGATLDTTVNMTFTIYTDAMGGSVEWIETQPGVVVTGSIFNVMLGSIVPLTADVFSGSERWLGVQVGTDPELVPRQRIGSVAYAFQSGGDGDWTISGDDVYHMTGNVGIGIAAPAVKLDVRGDLHVGADAEGYDVNLFGNMSGSRVYWDGGYMALRAGRDSDGTNWAPGLLGQYSLAAGYNTQAAGYGAVSLGYRNTANESHAVALGALTTAGGGRSIAMGWDSNAGGFGSLAVGHWIDAVGDYSMALGRYVTASDTNIVIGSGVDNASRLVNSTPHSLMVGFETDTPTLFVGGADHRVGIGTDTPAEKLDVAGTAQMTGFQMPTGAAAGRLLTADASGVGTWQDPAAISDGDWTIVGDDLYSNVADQVNIISTTKTTEGTTGRQSSRTKESGITMEKGDNALYVYGENKVTLRSYLYAWDDAADYRSAVQGIYGPDVYNAGSGYGYSQTNNGVIGLNAWGDPYTFGVAGYSDNFSSRSGGVIGANSGASYWGALGYYDENDSSWGVYTPNNAHFGGDVGIGVPYPIEKLHVNGNILLDPGFGIAFVDANTRIVEATDDLVLEADDDLYLEPDDDIFMNGSALFVDGATARVGVGTSVPVEKLEVAGTAQVTGFKMPTGAAAGRLLISDASGLASWQDQTAISDGDWTISGTDVYSAVTGNVGIGTSTPVYKLEVNGAAGINNWLFHNGDNDTYLHLHTNSIDLTSGGVIMLSANETTQDELVVNDTGTDVDFRVESVTDANALFVRGSDGDVGIRTTSPSVDLQVVDGTGPAFVQAKSLVSYAGFTIDKYSAADNGYVIYRTGGADTWVAGCMQDNNYRIRYWPTGTDALYCTSAGYVGIGTTSPSYPLHVFNSNGNYGYMASTSYGVRGTHNSGNYGYMGSSSYGVRGYHTSGNYGYIGGSSYGFFGEMASATVGDFAVYGDGADAYGEDGTGYAYGLTLGGVQGYNYYGNPYTFGVAGYSYLDHNRSGACFGGRNDANIWGCYGYQNSGGTEYGGYATSWFSGTGKSTVSTAIGFGSWGDLFGADVHGKVYGTYTEGGNYALYSNGTVFKNELDVHLQDTDDNSMAVFYTNVSTDVTVQTSGYSTLSAGRCTIAFDEGFKKAVSSEVPIVVTVTPIGNSNGVYVSEVKSDGFTVVENNDGKSDVQIAFIAIGRRAGYENPDLPQEVVSADYVEKLSRGLHNDADMLTDGEGLYYENGQLSVGMHPSVLPNPDKPQDEESGGIEEELLEMQETAKQAGQVKAVPAGGNPEVPSTGPASNRQSQN